MSEINKISKAEAKQVIDEVDVGFLLIPEANPLPVLGEIDDTDQEYSLGATGFEFHE